MSSRCLPSSQCLIHARISVSVTPTGSSKQAQVCENEAADSLVRQKIYRKGERDGKYAGRMSNSNDVQMDQPQLSVTKGQLLK